MRRFVAAAGALLLLLLGTQVILAQYTPSGVLAVSTTSPVAGAEVTVTGSGYGSNSEVRITLEPQPILLATVTTDQSGAFTARVKIPGTATGQHQLVATGVDPSGSVRVLVAAINVTGVTGGVLGVTGVPNTAASAPTTNILRSSDSIVLALAGVGIVVLTLVSVYLLRRRGSAA